MSTERVSIRRVFGSPSQVRVYHGCGERMLILSTYMDQFLSGECAWSSDWWCNRCAEWLTLAGDEECPARKSSP